MTGDGESWIKVVSKCRVLLDPVLADLIPGVAEKHGPGGGSVPQPARGMGLFASPNPFNPKTTIDLYLPSATSGSVKIFDIRGYMVAELYSGPMRQGQNTFTWQGHDNAGKAVASGVYWVMAQTADQKLTRKLLLIK